MCIRHVKIRFEFVQVLNSFKRCEERYQKRTGNKPPENFEQTVRVDQFKAEQEAKKKKVIEEALAAQKKVHAAAGAAGNGAGSGSSSSKSNAASSSSGIPVPPELVGSVGTGGTLSGMPGVPVDKENISTWNGAVTNKYRWNQSLQEVNVEIDILKDVENKSQKVKCKDLKIDMKGEKLKIQWKGETVLDEDFHAKILVSESVWNLEDSRRVVLSLQKKVATWWERVFVGDSCIDTTKVDSTKKVEDYDEKTQGTIRKIMYDQNAKAQGKPSSDQIRMNNVMENAWNAENSPFKGQPFDPSVLNLTNPLPDDFEETAHAQAAKEIEEKKPECRLDQEVWNAKNSPFKGKPFDPSDSTWREVETQAQAISKEIEEEKTKEAAKASGA